MVVLREKTRKLRSCKSSKSRPSVVVGKWLALVVNWIVGNLETVPGEKKKDTQLGHGGCRKKDKLCMLQRCATRNLMISCFLIVAPTLLSSSLNFKEDVTGDLFGVVAGLVRVPGLARLVPSPHFSAGALGTLFGAIAARYLRWYRRLASVVDLSGAWATMGHDGVVEPLAPRREGSPGFRGETLSVLDSGQTPAIVSSGSSVLWNADVPSGGGDSFENWGPVEDVC